MAVLVIETTAVLIPVFSFKLQNYLLPVTESYQELVKFPYWSIFQPHLICVNIVDKEIEYSENYNRRKISLYQPKHFFYI